jgi:hypothetical protein
MLVSLALKFVIKHKCDPDVTIFWRLFMPTNLAFSLGV